MWKIFGRAHSVAIVSLTIAVSVSTGSNAVAQTTTQIQNNSGFNLPGVTLPQGHDEVRAADGTTCRSAISGNGAYVDVGVIGSPDQNNVNAYTRVVIPLNAERGRIDCRKLYNLEVRRLEIELKLMELGLNRGIGPASEAESVPIDTGSQTASTADSQQAASPANVEVADASDSGDWSEDGWTTEGLGED